MLGFLLPSRFQESRFQGFEGFKVKPDDFETLKHWNLETSYQSSPTNSGSTETCTCGCAYVSFSCASTTAIAATLTTTSTVAERCSTWTGRLIPIRIGPMSSPPPIFDTSLVAILADARSGKMRTLAPPFSELKGYCSSMISGESASSAMISPSTINVGSANLISSTALRTLVAMG